MLLWVGQNDKVSISTNFIVNCKSNTPSLVVYCTRLRSQLQGNPTMPRLRTLLGRLEFMYVKHTIRELVMIIYEATQLESTNNIKMEVVSPNKEQVRLMSLLIINK